MTLRPDLRGIVVTGVAVVIHASVFVVLTSVRIRRAPAPPEEVAIEVSMQTDPSIEAPRAEESRTEPEGSNELRESVVALRLPLPAPSRAGEAPAETALVAPPASSGAPVMLFFPAAPGSADLHLDPLALAGAAEARRAPSGGFRSAAPEAPSPADAKRSVEQSIRAGVAGRDAELGLGPEGPVLNALRDAARRSLAPERGNATFLAVVDGSGVVVSLRLVGSTGGEPGWADARDQAARSLVGAKLTLRGAPKGAELQIYVESDLLLPSGSKAPVRPTIKDSSVAINPSVPTVGAGADVVKTYTVGEFDLADVGAKPRRVVHTRLVSMSVF